MKRSLLLCMLACSLTWAQGGDDSRPAPTNVRGADYPRVHSDSRVTFRLEAPEARRVQLQPNSAAEAENGLGKGPFDLVRGKDGVWTLTTPPVVPGLHIYHFLVDGMPAIDPGSETFMAGRGGAHYGESLANSGVEVPEKGVDFYLLKDVPHGVVQELWYYSKVTAEWRRAFVYTPPEYDRNSRARYPVLYLQHGGGDNESGWVRQGRMSFIMDNLLAAKKAVSMLVVMERGYANPPAGTQPPGGAASALTAWTAIAGDSAGASSAFRVQDLVSCLRFEDLVIRDLIPTIDARYRTIADREHRAIAGLSRGGEQAMQIGLAHLDTFASIGDFSGGSSARAFNPETSNNGIFKKVDVLNSKLKLLWVGSGEAEEPAYHYRRFHETLDKLGIRHVFYESPGTSHEWLTWWRHLNQFVPHLFR